MDPPPQDLTMWAYPKSPHHFKDALVCCVRHNPDPVVFRVSCNGVEPELKVDKKVLEFKKVLLHRYVSKEKKGEEEEGVRPEILSHCRIKKLVIPSYLYAIDVHVREYFCMVGEDGGDKLLVFYIMFHTHHTATGSRPTCSTCTTIRCYQ